MIPRFPFPILALAVSAAAALPPPDPARLEANRPRHDPAQEFVAISRDLGLCEIRCRANTGQFDRVELFIKAKDGSGKVDTRIVPMQRVASTAKTGRTPEGQPVDEEHYLARVRIDLPEADYRMWGAKLLDPAQRTESSTPSASFKHPIAPEIPTPDWAKGAVWYQIFPERFRNANPANDPNGSGVFLAPWSSDWYSVLPGELDARQARASRDPDRRNRPGGNRFQVILDRRYGGDLQGVIEKLDDLKSVGVTAIYLNPIFQARSLHKYDASDFRHIDAALANPPEAGASPPIDATYYAPPPGETDDPATWTWTPADRYFVDVFLPAVHARGMRVILDGVFNHTGKEFWAFADVRKNGRASKYADWYRATYAADGSLESYNGWDAKNGYLPEFRQVKGTGRDWDATVEKGDLNAAVKQHIFDITNRWMDPNGDGDTRDGIDGWRLDVVPDVGVEFWRSWRTHVKSINPDAIIVAEVWHDADDIMKGDTFDTQMHYPFAYPTLEWLANASGNKGRVSLADLRKGYDAAFSNTPATNLIHQNLFASHDTDRYVSMLANPGRGYDRANRPGRDNDSKTYRDSRPDDATYRLAILGVAIQACCEGAPMVYYGDELGMWGADDPDCRKPTPWPDLSPNANEMDRPLPWVGGEYTKWLTLRQHPEFGDVLRFGRMRILESGNDDLLLIERQLNERIVLLVVNRGDQALSALDVASHLPHALRAPPPNPDGAPNFAVSARSARVFGMTLRHGNATTIELAR